MRRLLILAVALGSAIVLTPVGAAHAAPTSAAPIAWGACPPPEGVETRDPREQCATLSVPLDYHKPSGRHITVEISRIATSVPGQRRGILMSNPGGPGGPGLDLPTVFAQVLPPNVQAMYDLIGFDPRGVGYSTPVTCGLDVNAPQFPTLALPYPSPDGSIARNIAWARAAAASCTANSGDLMPYITTANTARDMDAIRAALGEPKLSYYGISYGTYLGGVYTSLFPSHSDRVILDSSVDPTNVWYQFWRTWNQAVPIRLPDFLKWAAARDATYHFGATPDAVRDTYYSLIDKLDAAPVQIPGSYLVDGNLLREVTRSGLYQDSTFPDVAASWQTAAQLAGAAPATVSPSARAAFPVGKLDPMLSTKDFPGVPADNNIAVVYGITCDDAAWPRDPSVYATNVASDRQRYPVLNGMPSGIWPCAYWPTRPIEPPVTVTDRGPRDVLMLQNTRDPATDLHSALGMRTSLGRRAAMVLVDEGGHGVFGLGSCADHITVTYLATGVMPATDQFCGPPAAPTGHSMLTN